MLNMLDVAIGFATIMLAFSLIIMSLTQALAGLLALRGAKLRRGLQELLKQVVPDVSDAQAKTISQKIVEHPLASDAATNARGRWSWASTIKREELIPVLDAVLADPNNTHGITLPLAPQVRAALNAWFDPFMARVSQWYVMNTRWITVGLAIIIAFGLHLDSGQLVRQIHDDSVTRGKLSAMSSSLLDQTPEATKQVENSYVEALNDVVKSNAGQVQDNTKPASVKVTSRSQGANWIRENARTPADVDGLTAAFNAALDARLATSLDRSIDRVRTLEADLTNAGLVLYPTAEHDWRHWTAVTTSHFGGLVASVLFLSLGAPFWFNLLKNMTSLRSVVAQKESQTEKAEAELDRRVTSVAAGIAAQPSLPDLPPKSEKTP